MQKAGSGGCYGAKGGARGGVPAGEVARLSVHVNIWEGLAGEGTLSKELPQLRVQLCA